MPKRPVSLASITDQERAFLAYYAEHGRKMAALHHAYPHTRDWSPGSAGKEANRKLARLKPAYLELTRSAVQRIEANTDKVTASLAAIAWADRTQIQRRGPDGKPVYLPPDEWPDDVRQAVRDYQLRDGEVVWVKFHDPMPALNALARHLGYYEADNKQQVSGLADLIRDLSNHSLGLPEPPAALDVAAEEVTS